MILSMVRRDTDRAKERKRMHATALEILAEAHRYLERGGTFGKSGPEAALDEIESVTVDMDEDDMPDALQQARDALERDDPDPNVEGAKQALEELLRNTDYDPKRGANYPT